MNRQEKENLKKDIIRQIKMEKEDKRSSIMSIAVICFFAISVFSIVFGVPISILLQEGLDFPAGVFASLGFMLLIITIKGIIKICVEE